MLANLKHVIGHAHNINILLEGQKGLGFAKMGQGATPQKMDL